MSVYIRGMKMPKSCMDCPFKGFDRAGGRGTICTINESITLHAVLDGVDVKFVRMGDCPLVEVPSADVDELQKPKWIPVTERLPEVGKSVLVISYGRVCFAKRLLTENNGGYPTFVLQDGLNNPPVLEITAHNEFTKNRITHWMPLPEPPKEEKQCT